MPTFYMLIGVPASGKSTWRARLSEHIDFVAISSDDKIENYAKSLGLTYSDVFKHVIRDASKKMEDDLKHAICENRNIVWDQTNLTAESRRKKLMNIPAHYYKIAVYFPIPEDLDARLASRQGKNIPSNVMENMKSQLEIPTLDEGWNEVIFR